MASGLVPFTYVIPTRPHRWRRVQIIEYAGHVVRDGPASYTFTATGPLTRTVHDRRFWLMRSARRYLDRLKAGRHG